MEKKETSSLANLIAAAGERTKTGRPTAAAKRAIEAIVTSGIHPNSPEFFKLTHTDEQKVRDIIGAEVSNTHVKPGQKSGGV